MRVLSAYTSPCTSEFPLSPSWGTGERILNEQRIRGCRSLSDASVDGESRHVSPQLRLAHPPPCDKSADTPPPARPCSVPSATPFSTRLRSAPTLCSVFRGTETYIPRQGSLWHCLTLRSLLSASLSSSSVLSRLESDSSHTHLYLIALGSARLTSSFSLPDSTMFQQRLHAYLKHDRTRCPSNDSRGDVRARVAEATRTYFILKPFVQPFGRQGAVTGQEQEQRDEVPLCRA